MTQPTTWSFDNLLALAPNGNVLKEARGLFFARGWRLLAGNGQWIWGEYESSEGNLYRAAVRLDPPFFQCDCRAAQRPCRHALALVMLLAHRQDRWQVVMEAPEWVQAKPSPAKAAEKVADDAKPTDARRLALMEEGVEELARWLDDVITQGLAVQDEAEEQWEAFAARMVDCKLGGIARRIRQLREGRDQPDWPDRRLAELALLQLFVRAWQRRDQLSADRRRELYNVAGWSIREEEVLQRKGVTDHWLIIGQTEGATERLRYRRTWLRGERGGQLRLLLDFSYGDAGFVQHWLVGSAVEGELVPYPGYGQHRAAFRQFKPSNQPYDGLGGHHHLEEALTDYAQGRAANPFWPDYPLLLTEVTPVYDAGGDLFLLVDDNGHSLPIFRRESVTWSLLAVSGGHPVSVFGEYDGRHFHPLSVIHEGRLIGLGNV